MTIFLSIALTLLAVWTAFGRSFRRNRKKGLGIIESLYRL